MDIVDPEASGDELFADSGLLLKESLAITTMGSFSSEPYYI